LASGPDDPIISDTRELNWSGASTKHGLVSINTAHSQALVGFCKDNPQKTANLSVQVDPPFCAITVSALDDQPIPRAGTLLLTATARVSNTAMCWAASRNTLEKWGSPPPCIEPVTGAVVLRNLEKATAVTARPLDGAGRLLGPEVKGVKGEEGWKLPLGEHPTTWYVVSVSH
jgi:hypothetical protein